MGSNIEDVRKIIEDKNLKTGEDTIKAIKKEVRESSFAEKNTWDMIVARGKVLELSTHLEESFNGVIILVPRLEFYGHIIFNTVLEGSEKYEKELANPKEAVKSIDKESFGKANAGFLKKAGYVKTLLKKYDKGRIYNKTFTKKFDKLVRIRNRFAHVTINTLSDKLVFSDQAYFDSYFTSEKNRDVKYHFEAFKPLYDEILAALRSFTDYLEKKGVVGTSVQRRNK